MIHDISYLIRNEENYGSPNHRGLPGFFLSHSENRCSGCRQGMTSAAALLDCVTKQYDKLKTKWNLYMDFFRFRNSREFLPVLYWWSIIHSLVVVIHRKMFRYMAFKKPNQVDSGTSTCQREREGGRSFQGENRREYDHWVKIVDIQARAMCFAGLEITQAPLGLPWYFSFVLHYPLALSARVGVAILVALLTQLGKLEKSTISHQQRRWYRTAG